MTGSIRHIFVLDSLDSSDGVNFSGTTLYNDVIKRRIELYEKDISHNLETITDKKTLIEYLTYLTHNARYLSGGILIHFEMHGDKELKGLVLENGDLVKWKELCNCFREININCSNTLFITLGTCNGRYLYKGADPKMKSPYSGYISASKEVKGQAVYDNFSSLFEEIISCGNVVKAYLEMEKRGTDFYYKDTEMVFKAAFESAKAQLLGNEAFLAEMISQTERVTGKKLSIEESKIIQEKALSDLFKQQYASYQFTDNKNN